MIRQCAILFGCLALGELIVFFTGIKLPSSIIGMLLLTLFLKLGWIKLHWVQGMSDFMPIVNAAISSTLQVIVVTGWVHQLTRKIKGTL